MGLFGKLFGSKQPAPPCAIHPSDKDLVREEDVAWWDGLSIDDCKTFEQQDNIAVGMSIKHSMEDDGLSEEDAVKKVRRILPWYYWTLEQRDNEHFPASSPDAKLPYVIKDRFNRAMMRGKVDSQELSRCSSMNALVRQLIHSGTI